MIDALRFFQACSVYFTYMCLGNSIFKTTLAVMVLF